MISNLHGRLSASGPTSIHSCSLSPASQRMHVRYQKVVFGREEHIPGNRYPSLNRPYTFQYSQVGKSGYSPYYIRIHRDTSHVTEAVFHVVEYCHFAEGVNGGHAVARGITKQYTVFHMDASQPPRLQYAHKFRRKVIHLLKELAVVLIMSEIIIGRSVLIVVGKRDAGYNQIYRIIFHLLTFKNIVVIDRFPKFTEFFPHDWRTSTASSSLSLSAHTVRFHVLCRSSWLPSPYVVPISA